MQVLSLAPIIGISMDGSYKIKTAWEEPEDLLQRKEHAEFLTCMMTGRPGPYVLNLNAPWGFGKTFFIKSWAKSIEGDHPVVYINAWESDYSNDPLLAVMSAIDEQLIKALDNDGGEIRKNLMEKGGRLLRNIAPIIAKGVAKKLLNPNEVEEVEKEIGDFTSDDASTLSEVIGNTTQALLEEHRTKENSIKKFQSALGDLVTELSDDGNTFNKPIFIFVDEMDRCRPTYAVELLEAIKHLFSVDGIVFVIATDTEQLQHAIRAIYGEGFNGQQYLHRFFDQEFTLPYPEHLDFALALTHDEDDDSKYDFAFFLPNKREDNSYILPFPDDSESLTTDQMLALVLSFMSQSFNLSLRSTKQVWERFSAIITTATNKWDVVWLFFLLCLQSSNAGVFRILARDIRNSKDNRHIFESIEPIGLTMQWIMEAGYPKKVTKENKNALGIGLDYLHGIILGINSTENNVPRAGALNLASYARRRTFIELRDVAKEHVPLLHHVYAVEQAGYLGGDIES